MIKEKAPFVLENIHFNGTGGGSGFVGLSFGPAVWRMPGSMQDRVAHP
jgi:hypothetical protein